MGTLLLFVLALVLFVVYFSRQKKSTDTRVLDLDDRSVAPQFSITVSAGARQEIEGTPSTSEQCWLPPGAEARLAGKAIGDGFVYIGKNLPSVSEWGGVEPALIDPKLPWKHLRPDHAGEGMTYWPSYSTIPPSSRSAYLAWLASGRSNPDADISYVFLYFYGLERRALHDAKSIPSAKAEIPLIEAEVRRLLSIYGENGSFSGYASQFLEFLEVTAEGWQVPDEPPAQEVRRSWFGTAFQVGVGRMAVEQKPLPVEWALAWARQDPSISLRTPARRCQEEFEELFRILYQKKYGEGFRIKPCKRKISAEYRPASASFHGSFSSDIEVPDVTRLVGPRRKVEEIVEACCDALDSYSRWLGRNPEGRGTLRSTGLLPPELIATRAPRAFDEMRDELRRRVGDEGGAVLPARAVFRHWFAEKKDRLTKKQIVEAAHLFGHAGFGFEPDVRFSGRTISSADKVAVFPLEEEDRGAPSAEYSAAAILLHLASLVAASDGQVSRDEKEHLRDHLAAGLRLDEVEKTRLGAHLEWLLAQPPRTPGGKKRLEKLLPEQRRSLGEFLIAVAWADGRVEPEEVRTLTRIFRLLGLDPGDVHQWLHSHQAASDLGPIAVTSNAGVPDGYSVPPAPGSEAASPDAVPRVELDMETIAAKHRESERIALTLVDIFSESEDSPPRTVPGESEVSPIKGLDAAHAELLQRLAGRESWARAEYDDLADSLGLLPNGALDQLNEVAFEACDEPLIEGSDPLELNPEVVQEMTA